MVASAAGWLILETKLMHLKLAAKEKAGRAGWMNAEIDGMEEIAERAWGKMGEMVWKLDGRDVIDFPQVLHLVGDFVPMF